MYESFATLTRAYTEDALRELKSLNASSSECLRAHMRLAESEMQALEAQERYLQDMAALSQRQRLDTAARRRSVAQSRRDELLRKIEQLTNQSASTETQPRRQLQQWAAIYSELALYRERLAYLLACPSTAGVAVAREEHAGAFASDSWATLVSAVTTGFAMLERNGGSNRSSSSLFTDDLRQQLDGIQKMQLQAAGLLNVERKRRRLRREGTAELFKDQEKLLLWCSEQLATLKELKSLSGLRKFLDSFSCNVGVMDTNFLVLLERSDALGPSSAVREALLEVNRAWTELSVFAYQMTREAVNDGHTASGVEDGCRRWSELFEQRVKRTLVETCATSSHNEEVHEALPQSLQESGDALLTDFRNVCVVMHHISELSMRQECVAPHEESLCQALLTPLSVLTHTFTGNVDFAIHREYVERLREVGDWLDSRATGKAFGRLITRVGRLRDVARRLLDSLPLDEENMGSTLK
ncbi:hypothetical protein TRVL_03722 [Trypanosoma vivax]|nr:hypothetical protein TRVL_03722 [Trypanosoma vivax]